MALAKKGEIEIVGKHGLEWMGAPLKADGRTVGVDRRPDAIARIAATRARTWTCSSSSAQHVGSALVRARAIEETRQRNAELAIVNEIGAALAKQLDFEAIVELVGQRVATIFAAHLAVRRPLRRSQRARSASRTRSPRANAYHTEPFKLGDGADVAA